MKEDLLKIINNYGVLPQLKYFQSEVFELNEAIIEYENAYFEPYTDSIEERSISEEEQKQPLKEHIAEEIADVLNMVEQFMYYYDIDIKDVIEIKHQKIHRQLERIENER